MSSTIQVARYTSAAKSRITGYWRSVDRSASRRRDDGTDRSRRTLRVREDAWEEGLQSRNGLLPQHLQTVGNERSAIWTSNLWTGIALPRCRNQTLPCSKFPRRGNCREMKFLKPHGPASRLRDEVPARHHEFHATSECAFDM